MLTTYTSFAVRFLMRCELHDRSDTHTEQDVRERKAEARDPHATRCTAERARELSTTHEKTNPRSIESIKP